MNYHKFLTRPDRQSRKPGGLEKVPDDLLVEWSFKLFALMNLTWDYIDTICDICIAQKIGPTKPLVRAVRSCKTEYDRFRWQVMSRKMEEDEAEHGLRFEERYGDDFRRLLFGIELEVNKHDLVPAHRTLVIAVQQALTLMDAVKVYARRCDSRIASFGAWVCDCCMVHTEFMKLYDIIPQFAGDCYDPCIEARKLTAGILANRLEETALPDLLGEDEYIRIDSNDTDRHRTA